MWLTAITYSSCSYNISPPKTPVSHSHTYRLQEVLRCTRWEFVKLYLLLMECSETPPGSDMHLFFHQLSRFFFFLCQGHGLRLHVTHLIPTPPSTSLFLHWPHYWLGCQHQPFQKIHFCKNTGNWSNLIHIQQSALSSKFSLETIMSVSSELGCKASKAKKKKKGIIAAMFSSWNRHGTYYGTDRRIGG